MSCIMSSHRFFYRPRLWRPLTSAVIILFMKFSSSLLITRPYHLNLASRILSVMRATPSVFLMASLPFLSFSETPSIHRSILISVPPSSSSSLLVTVQEREEGLLENTEMRMLNLNQHCIHYCIVLEYNTIQYNADWGSAIQHERKSSTKDSLSRGSGRTKESEKWNKTIITYSHNNKCETILILIHIHGCNVINQLKSSIITMSMLALYFFVAGPSLWNRLPPSARASFLSCNLSTSFISP